jgi:DNA-directed RNA polymerase specialized sigma24 family protein
VRVVGVEQDRREFAEFYAAARDDCLKIVVISVGDRQLAEDLVAEAFTRAWMSWRKVHRLAEPRGWVVRVALNAHVSWWRRHRREVALGGHDRVAAAGQDPVLDSWLRLTELFVRLPAGGGQRRDLVIGASRLSDPALIRIAADGLSSGQVARG